MALRTNVVRRGSIYYVRASIPDDVRQHFPNKGKEGFKEERWQSLRTSDPNVARTRSQPVLAQWSAEYEELRRRKVPSEADLQGAVWSIYERELQLDRAARMNNPTETDVDAAHAGLLEDVAAGRIKITSDPLSQLAAGLDVMVMADQAKLRGEGRARYIATLQDHLARGETALIEWAADEEIQRSNLLIQKGTPEYRDLCQRLQRGLLEALKRADERDAGNWSGVPGDPIVIPPLGRTGRTTAAPGESIMELYDRFKREREGAIKADTWDQNRKIVQLFAEFVGETSHISAVNRKNVRDWKHQLSLWPIKAADTKAFHGMSFKKIIQENATLNKPTIKQKTINKYLSAIGAFSGWLLSNEYIEQDVIRGMLLIVDKRKKEVFPYSIDELNVIFSSPLFSTCQGDKKEHRTGNIQIRDWRYWIPLIGLYSGARLGEIAQMRVDDIRQLHGTWIFHITEEGQRDESKSTKNEGSMRVVPVHSQLIDLGLIDYVKVTKATGETQLFPEIKPDARGYYSGRPSSFFNDYFRKIGVKADKSQNFHSFRHGIADAFRRAGYLDEQFAMLLGHTKASTTGKYGIMPEGPLAERVNMIEAVAYPEVSFFR